MDMYTDSELYDGNYTEPESTSQYAPYSEHPETYVVPALFALIFIAGVLGNGTLVLIFVWHRTMRNVPNTYILSLAVGDLLVILTCVPFTSTLYTVESWNYGTLVCKLSECVKDMSIGVSVFTLTALSAERYCAIVNPMRRHFSGGCLSTRSVTLLTTLAIWILSLLFALPAAIYSYVPVFNFGENHTIKICSPIPEDFGWSDLRTMVLLKFLAYYVLPLCVISVFYTLMAMQLQTSARSMPGELQGQSAQVRAHKKVAKMVLAFVVIFFLCFLPEQVFMLWFHLYPSSHEVYDEYWHALRIVGFCLSFIHSCANPIALYCMSDVFRKHFNSYLFCCCTRRNIRRRGSACVGVNSLGNGGAETSSHSMDLSQNPAQLHAHYGLQSRQDM